ncbi:MULTISPECIES: MFS transporter [Agrobacterium tumefaciens complex]|uniref:MFS transporter n=1 Tax=Agrobacterium tumefaciens complex TaxID=1183400 RepID=UPI00215832FD|nr:MFS transporter [Agrobacterium fabrum]MCR6727940.1 MFS transporter [Agrobacterium fabrum]UXT00478.1 MFS transporter [Agrobacterium tumefaciens]
MFDDIRALGSTYQTYWFGTLMMQLSTQIFLVVVSWKLTSDQPSEDKSFMIYVLANVPFVLLTFISAELCRRFTYRKTHLLGQLLSGLATALFWLYVTDGSISAALTSIFVWHCGIAIRGPAYQATIADLFEKEKRTSAFAYHDIAVNLSRLIGPVIASWILISHSLRAWFVFSLSSIAITVFAIVAFDKSDERSTGGISLLVGTPSVRRRLLTLFAISLIFVCNLALLPALVRQEFGNVETLAAFTTAWSIGAIVGSITQASISRLFRRWEMSVLLFASSANMIIMSTVSNIPLCLISILLGGGASVIIFLRMKTSFLLLRPTSESATLLSSYFFATYLGFAAGAALWGFVGRITSPSHVYSFASVIVLCFSLVSLFAATNKEPNRGQPK